MEFTTRNGEKLNGKLIHQYPAFEGGIRYIIEVNGNEYRCVKNENDELIELVI